MALLEMGYDNLDTDMHVKGVCVDFDRFLADLDFTAGTTDKKDDGFPTEAYHAQMENILMGTGLGRLKLPLFFSVVLNEWDSMLGFDYRFMFLAVDKEFFKQIRHEYAIDGDIAEKCLSADTDVIVVYTGMTKLD